MKVGNIQIDYVGRNGNMQGDVAKFLMKHSRLDVNSMQPFIDLDERGQGTGLPHMNVYMGGDKTDPRSYRTIQVNDATLRRDEWKQLDSTVQKLAEQRLGAYGDLDSNGLVFNLGNAMGTTVLEYHDISDAMEAVMTMDGITRGQNDRPVYGAKYLPIPIIHVDFEINLRELEASRSKGNPLDTTSVERATRKILQLKEDLLFTNRSYTFGGGTIASYTNFTYRNQVTLSLNWDNASKTGDQIVEDVRKMVQAAVDAHMYGPYMLYIPTAYQTVIDKDYNEYKTKTIRQRIMEIEGIKGIRVVDRLTANNVLLVQMTQDVVRNVKGLPISVIEWGVEGKFITKYKVMCIEVPQIRADYENHCGVVHLAA